MKSDFTLNKVTKFQIVEIVVMMKIVQVEKVVINQHSIQMLVGYNYIYSFQFAMF